MKITCESCGAKYTIADKKVQGRRVKIRCKSCSKQIVVDAKPDESEDAGVPVHADEGSLGEEQVAPDPHAVATTWEVNLSDTDQRSMTEAEILAGWESGVVTQNAFVWKDGLADWMPIGQVPELVPEKPEAEATTAAPKPVSPSLPPAPPARIFGDKPKAHKAAAKLPGSGAKPDLFGRAAAAGSEEDAQNQMLAGATPYVEQNPTGARNENSVLFSIDALKAGFSKTPARSEPAPKHSDDDPFGMSLATGGVMGGLALAGNDALLSQPAPEPPKPAPVVAAAAMPAGSVAPADDKRKLVAILGAAVALLLAIIVVMALSGKKDDEKLAQLDPSASAHADKTPGNADGKPADSAESEKKSADISPEAAAKTADNAAKDGADAKTADKGSDTKASTATKTHTDVPTGGKPPVGKPDDVKVKDKPSSGVASFNTSAAKTSLSSAANSAAGCARPDGAVGKGQVVVTFAPSGRVTSANVGAPFGGTRVGSCVASIFRRASVPPFSGANVTVSKSFTISR